MPGEGGVYLRWGRRGSTSCPRTCTGKEELGLEHLVMLTPSVSTLVHSQSHRLSVGTCWVVSIQPLSANSTCKQLVLWSCFPLHFLGMAEPSGTAFTSMGDGRCRYTPCHYTSFWKCFVHLEMHMCTQAQWHSGFSESWCYKPNNRANRSHNYEAGKCIFTCYFLIQFLAGPTMGCYFLSQMRKWRLK